MPFIASDAEASEVGGGFIASPDEASEVQSGIESASRGALRNFPLAQQTAAALAPVNPFSGKPTYGAELQHLTEAAEQGKAQNPKSYYGGAAAGSLLPLAVPGFGEALEAAPILGNAALGAAQGISDTSITQHPGQAAGEAALGGGIGGIMGALGSYLSGKFGGKAAPAASEAVAPAEEAAISAPVAEAIPTPTAPPAAPQAAPSPIQGRTPGGIVPDQTAVAKDFVPTADRIAASNWARGIGFTPRKFASYAREMGENPQTAALEGQAWSNEKGLIQWMDHPGEALERITPIKQAAGKTIGDAMDKFGSQPIPAAEIESELLDLAKRTANPSAKGTLVNVADRISDMADDGVLDWHSMNELKGMVGQEVKEHPNLSKAYGLLSQRMNAMAETTGKAIGDPALLEKYMAAKKDYRMASLLEPALLYSESKNLIGGAAGHNTLRGVLGQLAEAFTGAPPAEQIVKNAMAKSAPIVKAVGRKGAQVRGLIPNAIPATIKGIPGKLPQAAQMELANALTSKFKRKGE